MNNRDQYNNLKGGSRARLAKYKAALAKTIESSQKHRTPEEAAAWAERNGYNEPDAWKFSRWVTPHGLGFATPYGSATHHPDRYGGVYFADAGYLDHLRAPNRQYVDLPRDYGNTYWFADNDMSLTVKPAIVALPARHGVPRFLAYAEHSNDCMIMVDGHIHDDGDDAYRAACLIAERWAEDSREDDALFQAASSLDRDIEETREEMEGTRKDLADVLKCYRDQRALGAVADSLAAYTTDAVTFARDRMHGLLEKLAEQRAARADIDYET